MEDKEIQEIFEKYFKQTFPNEALEIYTSASLQFLQSLHQNKEFLEKNGKNNTYTKLRDLLCSSYLILSITRWLITTKKEGKYQDTTQLVSDKFCLSFILPIGTAYLNEFFLSKLFSFWIGLEIFSGFVHQNSFGVS
jgi:diphthamide synthase subunit DPH2